jgi:hypothetical protein
LILKNFLLSNQNEDGGSAEPPYDGFGIPPTKEEKKKNKKQNLINKATNSASSDKPARRKTSLSIYEILLLSIYMEYFTIIQKFTRFVQRIPTLFNSTHHFAHPTSTDEKTSTWRSGIDRKSK